MIASGVRVPGRDQPLSGQQGGFHDAREVEPSGCFYFANIARIDLYSNNAVFVVDRNDRVVSKVAFGNPTDARSFIDVLSFYRARRLQGAAPTAASATAP